MRYYSSHYYDGHEIHAGDVFLNGDRECQVVAVTEWNEWVRGYGHWLEVILQLHESGFAYLASFGIVTAGQSDEDGVLIRRGDPAEIEHGKRGV